MPYKFNPLPPEFDRVSSMTGFITGPGSSTDNALVRWDGVLGTAVQNSNAILTDGGSLSLAIPLEVASGGTAATTAAGARTNLGLGTISVQDASNVAITGGSITGITDLAPADGGTGTSSIPTNGQILIGNGTNYTVSTITAGSNITITNGSGSIQIATINAGDVVGPASSTDEALVRFDSTTGKLIQNSNATLTDAGALTLATPLTVANGGTGRATLTNHGILVGATTTAITQLAAGSAGQILQSGGASADPAYSTATYPSTAGTSGKILISDGTNIVSSTPTYPNASVTAGKFIISDGTNYIASTPTLPNSATGTGTILRADGTNWVATSSTYPATNSQGDLLYGSASNVLTSLAKDTNATRYLSNTGSSNNPAWAQVNVANGVTGTLPVGNGGTGGTTFTVNGVLIGNATGVFGVTSAGTSGQIFQSASPSAPGWTTATFPSTATGTGTILRANGTNWVATTATYPTTTTSQQILYSSADNVIGQLTTANSKFPATNSSGTLAMRAFSVVIQTFVADGTYTPTSGMLYCQIEVVGSGGGGGGAAATAGGTLAYGGGGGGGEYARGIFSAATVGASQAVTCPAGGAGGTAGANNGTAGATTSVGSLITAGGGGAGGGATAAATGSASAGTAGSGGSGGSFRLNGGPGEFGNWSVGVIVLAGEGGNSYFSNGTRGTAATATGATGTGYGGGGGGGTNTVSGAAQAGGPGSSGLVVITEYVIS